MAKIWHNNFAAGGMQLPPLPKAVLIVILLFGIFAGLYFAKPFLVPFALACIFSMLFLPLSRKMESKGLNKGVAALLCIGILFAALAGIITLVSWQVSQLLEDKAKLEQQVQQGIKKVQSTIDAKLGVPPQQQKEIIEQQKQSASGTGGKVFSTISGVLLDGVIMVVYIFFLMFSRTHVKKAILQMVPQDKKRKTEKVLHDTTTVAHKYLTGLGMMIFCLWIMYGIGFSLLGVKNAIFFAMLCGLLEIIPFIGNLLGTTVTILVSVVQGGDITMVIGILIVYGIVQFIQGNVLEPLIVGAEVNVNALATILVLVIGELLWGIPGIVLAIPMLGIIKVICDNVDGLKPIGYLIGQDKKESGSKLKEKVKGWFGKK